jgi:hypothetical protein
VPQVLEFTFPDSHSSVGFTIVFDRRANQYAADFLIEVFDDNNNLMASEDVHDNTLNYYISDLPVDGYYRVKITFTKTHLPYRRIRVAEVIFGIIQNWDSNKIIWADILYEMLPSVEKLPSNELVVMVENLDKKYNIRNPHGIYKYLQQGQSLDVRLGIGNDVDQIEYVKIGRFYYTKSSAEEVATVAQFVAHDRFYILHSSSCRIGESGEWTVLEAVIAVIADSNLPIVFDMPSNIAGRVIGKCIPKDTSHREALRLIAQASRSICYFNRDDTLVFTELSEGEHTDELNNELNLLAPADIHDLGRINKVEVVVRDDYAEETEEVIYTAVNKEVNEIEISKVFENPLVLDQEVAEWLLTILQKRVKYLLEDRGNPARELCDTIRVRDDYNENNDVVVIRHELNFDGGLTAKTETWGGV